MKKLILFIALVTCMSLAAMGQSSQDTQSVKKVVILFQNDFNDGRFNNAPMYTTNDWEHINPGGGIDKGRDRVLKTVRSVHQTFLKGVSMTIDSMTIRFITPDVAIADVFHKLSTYKLPAGVKHKDEREIKTYVFVKQKGKWLLTLDQNTTIAQ